MSQNIIKDTKTVVIRQTFLKEIKSNFRQFQRERPKDIEKIQKVMIDEIKESMRSISKQGETNYNLYLSDIKAYVEKLEKKTQNNLKLKDVEVKAILKSIAQYFEIEGFDCTFSRYPIKYSENKNGENVCISWE